MYVPLENIYVYPTGFIYSFSHPLKIFTIVHNDIILPHL